jgi:hypothetical protein
MTLTLGGATVTDGITLTLEDGIQAGTTPGTAITDGTLQAGTSDGTGTTTGVGTTLGTEVHIGDGTILSMILGGVRHTGPAIGPDTGLHTDRDSTLATIIRDITLEQAQVQDLTTEGMYIMARGTVRQPIGKWAGTTV